MGENNTSLAFTNTTINRRHCGKPVYFKEFRDLLSKKEFIISGLCQLCQNIIFR